MFETPAPHSTAAAGRPAPSTIQNRLLAALPPAELERLAPCLEPVTLGVLERLVEMDGVIDFVYFPLNAVISVVRPDGEGTWIETGTVGCEGLVGAASVLGVDWSPTRLEAQVPGDCLRIPVGAFRELLTELPNLRSYIGIFLLGFIDQVGQSVVCNNRHEIGARCARWLLMAQDRVERDEFLLTHQVLARMLGVRRAGVTEAMQRLKNEGMVDYRRGRLMVRDRAKLEAAACPCYLLNRTHLTAIYSSLDPAIQATAL